MSNEERYKEYTKIHCKNCKHKKEELCNIRISAVEGVVQTKCNEYERDVKLVKKECCNQ